MASVDVIKKMDPILFLTAAAHMFYTPFTKVEESFNLQAMHDILYWRHNITQYDHHEYPGVVPRTFLGPLFIAILSSPFVLLFNALRINKFWAQYVVRLVLAAVVTIAWNNLRKVLAKIYSTKVCLWLTMITLSQFHFMFYMTRPLPNIFALPLVLCAVAYWLQGKVKYFIIYSGIAIIMFRSELILFLGLLLVHDLIIGRIKWSKLLKICIQAGIVILLTTIVVDSFFWQRLVWPEGAVLWYNTVLNKSANWGTSPFLWYFYSALPRAMGSSLVFVPIGIYLEHRIRPIVFSAFVFVFIYSFLPHKELRFIIYVFPVLNLAAACACNRLWLNRSKSVWQGLLALCAGAHIIVNVLVTLFLLFVSAKNYPGGVALSRLHRLETLTPNVSVHIENLAAQSGVSRFMEIRSDWRYCKNETVNYNNLDDLIRYTHLLVEAKNKFNNQIWNTLHQDFFTVEFVDCFHNIGIQYNSVFPVRVKTKPCIAILKRRRRVQYHWRKQEIPTENGHDLATESKTDTSDTSVKTSNSNFFNEKFVSKHETVINFNQENVESFPKEVKEFGEEIKANISPNKEINFQELHNLAMGKVTKKTSNSTKNKLRAVIENYYRAKGLVIETDLLEEKDIKKSADKSQTKDSKSSVKNTVKAVIRQEKIKEMIEQIANMDLSTVCDFNKITTKDCLKQVINNLDNNSITRL